MAPVNFENLCKAAFDQIKSGLGTIEGEIVYEPKAGGSFEIRGVFDDRGEEIDPDTEQLVSTNIYTLGVKLDDLPFTPDKGDSVTIKNQLYRVINALEDGVPGVSTVLVLHRVD